MGSLYLWGHSVQEMGGDVVIGRSMHGVVVIDGSLYSDSMVFHNNKCNMALTILKDLCLDEKVNTLFYIWQSQTEIEYSVAYFRCIKFDVATALSFH